MTFSLVARCAQTGMFGIAITSSSPAVAARCAYTRAGIGAVASQNVTDPRLGPMALDLMQAGHSAASAIEMIQNQTNHLEYRQVLVVDHAGDTAIHSGTQSLGLFSDVNQHNVAAAGNLLADKLVPQIMAETFSASQGHLGDRLLLALQAGLAAGGEAGPIHSAGMQLCDKVSWPVCDLRCDWTEHCPIENIANAWSVYKPQLDAYIIRALDPSAAPSYGVPGDD